MSQELDYLTRARYATTDADAEEERRRRVEVFDAVKDLALHSFEMTDTLMAKLVPMPNTHDLERVYRLEIPFVIRYKRFGELSAQDLTRIDSFLRANCDLKLKEIVLSRERAEKEFGQPIQWENPLEILERAQSDRELSPE